MHFLTEADDGKWYLHHEGNVLEVVNADNQPVAALEVAHLVPGAGKWEQLSKWMYCYRPLAPAPRPRGRILPHLRHLRQKRRRVTSDSAV